MSDFKIDDRVKVVNDSYIWLTNHDLDRETILTVVEDDSEYPTYVNPDNETIEIGAIKQWPTDFEKVGVPFSLSMSESFNQVEGGWSLNKDDVVSVSIVNEPKSPIPELGVYRPNLADRKVGKVQMHMVDDGFPNALREIGKVMTWAADAKGYKLHDWKNLPEADIALPSAGYRHRNDNSIQKAQGVHPIDRLDHESNLLHKAHEAFNILAELELILTGVIK